MKPLITVLMCTYNGEKYITEQLLSIMNQTYENIRLIIYDDCSTDSTVEFINKFVADTGDDRVTVVVNEKPSGSSQKNFMHIIEDYKNSEYIALSDQDDIWNDKKLEVMMKVLQEHEIKDRPCMVCHKVETISDDGGHIGYTKLYTPDFCNLIFHPTAQGCCMLFNKACTDLLSFEADNIAMHDWYISLVYAVKNRIHLIDEPLLKYRQHENNVVGHKRISYMERLRLVLLDDEKVKKYSEIMSMIYEVSKIQESEFLYEYKCAYEARDVKKLICLLKRYRCFDSGVHGLMQIMKTKKAFRRIFS